MTCIVCSVRRRLYTVLYSSEYSMYTHLPQDLQGYGHQSVQIDTGLSWVCLTNFTKKTMPFILGLSCSPYIKWPNMGEWLHVWTIWSDGPDDLIRSGSVLGSETDYAVFCGIFSPSLSPKQLNKSVIIAMENMLKVRPWFTARCLFFPGRPYGKNHHRLNGRSQGPPQPSLSPFCIPLTYIPQPPGMVILGTGGGKPWMLWARPIPEENIKHSPKELSGPSQSCDFPTSTMLGG